MKRKTSSSQQFAAVRKPPVMTFYRISERTLITSMNDVITVELVEEAIKQVRDELRKFPGDVKPAFWALDATEVKKLDTNKLLEPLRRLFSLAKECISDYIILIREQATDAATQTPVIMLARGLAFGAQLKLRVITKQEEIGNTLIGIRAERDKP